MTKPQRLKPNDKVAIIATSSPCKEDILLKGLEVLKEMGLRPVVTESCTKTHDYLAADDNTRLNDLHSSFANKEIKGIFVARGGYGAGRLLPRINYEIIKQNPKVFVGFSDVTALHIVFNQLCNLITFHGPMPGANLHKAHPLTLSSLSQVLDKPHVAPAQVPKPTVLIPGNPTGILTGGNLSVIASTLGTPYEINTHNRILFLEDIAEKPYKVDRLFLQLKQTGKFKDAAGIVLGDFSPETTETLHTAINEIIMPENKPTICNFPCGHTSPTLTIPLGIKVSLHQLQKYGRFENLTEHTQF